MVGVFKICVCKEAFTTLRALAWRLAKRTGNGIMDLEESKSESYYTRIRRGIH